MEDKFLSQDEIDALLKGVSGESDETKTEYTPGEVRPYNLATQERIVRGRMPSLELINERFARLFRIGLYNLLRRNSEISVGPIRTTKYSEFLRHLMVPTNLNLIKINPLRGTGLVVMDPHLVFMLVDNFFGGDGRFHTRIEGREFSQTEQRIIQRVLKIVFENLNKAWEMVYQVEFEYLRSEMNTQFANIATPNEVVVTTTFGIELGTVSGNLHLCIPYSMIEPIRDLLRNSTHSESITHDQRWEHFLRHEIQQTEIFLSADLIRIPSSLRAIMRLNAGDILPINMPQTLELQAEGVPLFECSFGKRNGQYAVRVEKMLNTTPFYTSGDSDE